MVDNEVLASHRQEMARRGHPIYGLFETLDQAMLPADARAALQSEAARLAEIVVSQDFPADTGTEKTLKSILQSPEAPAILAAWRSALDAAAPSRKAMLVIYRHFGQWFNEPTAATQEPFLQLLPRVAPLAEQLKDAGVRKLLQAIAAAEGSESRETLRNCIEAYRETTGDIIAGISTIAIRAINWRQAGYLDQLLTTVVPEKAVETDDGLKLIPALAQLTESCAERGETPWRLAMDLILTLAQTNYSSAYVTAAGLPKQLNGLSNEVAVGYLKDFLRLAQAIGIRAVGFGLKQLPGFYAKYGVDRTRAFVEGAAAASEAYGTTAGEWFFDRKTEAARQLLGG